MLKPYYGNETDIPEDQKGAYEAKNGRYELKKLDETHPVLAHNRQLVSEKNEVDRKLTEAEAKVSQTESLLDAAKSELETAKSKTLANGQRAVSIEIADLGNAAKAAGFAKDELSEVKEKIESFEAEKTEQLRRENLTKAFEFAEVKNLDEAFNRKAADELNIEWKEVDGKKTPYVVEDKDGTKTETLFDKKYLENAEGFRTGVAALYADEKKKAGFMFPGQTDDEPPKNEYDAIRAEVKNEKKNAPPSDNASVIAALSGQKVATAN